MQTRNMTFTLLFTTLMLVGCSTKTNQPSPTRTFASGQTVDFSDWPFLSQLAAQQMIKRYGEPTESTPTSMCWNDVSPYKRIVVYREQVPHNFPLPHDDVIEHVISYKIPINKVAEIIKFNGSIKFDRTRGEISARSENEAMKLLALNMAYDIVKNKKDYTDARSVYGKLEIDYINGTKNLFTQSLQFFTQKDAADVDKTTKYNWPQAQEAEPELPVSKAEAARLLKQAEEEEFSE